MSILHETISILRIKIIELSEDLRSQKNLTRSLLNRIEKLENRLDKLEGKKNEYR